MAMRQAWPVGGQREKEIAPDLAVKVCHRLSLPISYYPPVDAIGRLRIRSSRQLGGCHEQRSFGGQLPFGYSG